VLAATFFNFFSAFMEEFIFTDYSAAMNQGNTPSVPLKNFQIALGFVPLKPSSIYWFSSLIVEQAM